MARAIEWALPVPAGRSALARLQSQRKRIAVERARATPFWRDKLADIDLDRLDEPDEWRRIPVLDKEMLRALPNEAFYDGFCHGPRAEIAEFWRSGGATGRPLFYPRTHADIAYAMTGFMRTFQCMGIGAGEIAHLSFPLGIHPAGQMWARAAERMGMGVAWAGSGATAPSAAQLELISMLQPTLWMGMPGYGLHLANLAEARGIDLAASSVSKILCTAEPLSQAKRDKLARMWGAEVFDAFGMTECAMMGAESPAHDGLHIWTDLAFIEVVDPESHEPVPEGEPGALVVTALYTNNATPFLRWLSGDIVTYHAEGAHDGPLSVFPMIRHAHRTAGFFKVRGVNISHAAFEDFMFAKAEVSDFKAEAVNEGGLDGFRVSLETARGAEAAAVLARLETEIKAAFELTPELVHLETGTLAAEFESAVKAPRFVDRR